MPDIGYPVIRKASYEKIDAEIVVDRKAANYHVGGPYSIRRMSVFYTLTPRPTKRRVFISFYD